LGFRPQALARGQEVLSSDFVGSAQQLRLPTHGGSGGSAAGWQRAAKKKLPNLPVFLENSSPCPEIFPVSSSPWYNKRRAVLCPPPDVYG